MAIGGIAIAFFVFEIFFGINFSDKNLVQNISESTDVFTPKEAKAVSEIIKPKEEEPKATIFAVGDMMLSRTVEKKLKKNGFDYAFLKVIDLISDADISLGNLETTIIAGREISTGEFSFRADPKVGLELKKAGFDILGLANNHIGNFGQEGFVSTFKILNENKIEYFGAGNNIEEAYNYKILEANGLKFAFLAYGYGPDYYEAGEDKAGMALLDLEKMKTEVLAAKKNADFVFVLMHSGIEYTEKISDEQKNFAHAAIDFGAEAVLGSHPHVVQKVEKYKDKYIFYSLGNFVFDQMWSDDTRNGLAVKLFLDQKGLSNVQFIPIKIDDYSQPRVMTESEANRVLRRLQIPYVTAKTLKGEGGDLEFGSGYFLNNFSEEKEIISDNDNDGNLEKTILENNQAKVLENDKILWQSDLSWEINDLKIGDLNNDSKDEWNFALLKKDDKDFTPRMFIQCFKDENRIDACFHSSPIDNQIIKMEIFDINSDNKNELIVIDKKDDMNNYLSVWNWNGWGVSLDSRFDIGGRSNLFSLFDKMAIVY